MLADRVQRAWSIFSEKNKYMQEESPAKNWRIEKVRYRLLGSRCWKCHKISYPAKAICPKCKTIHFSEDLNLKPYGKIVSYSMIYVAPKGFENFTPYPIVLIGLVDGPVVLSQLTDYVENDLKIGKKVEAVFRKISTPSRSGIVKYGLKFRPVI